MAARSLPANHLLFSKYRRLGMGQSVGFGNRNVLHHRYPQQRPRHLGHVLLFWRPFLLNDNLASWKDQWAVYDRPRFPGWRIELRSEIRDFWNLQFPPTNRISNCKSQNLLFQGNSFIASRTALQSELR